MGNPLTRPENYVEEAITRRMLAKVARAGGCGVCTQAVHGFGLSACSSIGRTFPLCLKTPGTRFDPDHERLQGA